MLLCRGKLIRVHQALDGVVLSYSQLSPSVFVGLPTSACVS